MSAPSLPLQATPLASRPLRLKQLAILFIVVTCSVAGVVLRSTVLAAPAVGRRDYCIGSNATSATTAEEAELNAPSPFINVTASSVNNASTLELLLDGLDPTTESALAGAAFGSLLCVLLWLATLWSARARAFLEFSTVGSPYVVQTSGHACLPKNSTQYDAETDSLARISVDHLLVSSEVATAGVRETAAARMSAPVRSVAFAIVPLEHDGLTGAPCFSYQMRRYVWRSDSELSAGGKFEKLLQPERLPLHEYAQATFARGNDEVMHVELMAKYGPNAFELPLPAFSDLYKEQVAAPFFVFQCFCMFLWMLDDMFFYSVFTLAMLLTFESTVTKQRLRNLSVLRQMGLRPQMVFVLRGREWTRVLSTLLVPGDIVAVGASYPASNSTAGDPSESFQEFTVPCDCVLLRGSCVVNEAMLTGESTPLTKDSVSAQPIPGLNSGEASHSILFSGTKIIQHTRGTISNTASPVPQPPDGLCAAYVLRTGFFSKQGKLMRTILAATERKTANNRESFLFILFLLCFAVVAAMYVAWEGLKDETRNRFKLLLNCSLIITSVVPPELPMELTLAVNTSLLALQRLAVVCTEPFRIPSAGALSLICLDKTGTITSDELILKGIAKPGAVFTEADSASAVEDVSLAHGLIKASRAPFPAQWVLAGCQSLIRSPASSPTSRRSRDIIGDPLEVASLRSIRWTLTSDSRVASAKKLNRRVNGAAPNSEGKVADLGESASQLELRILKRFRFSSARKCMTTVCAFPRETRKIEEQRFLICSKGAPERVREFINFKNNELSDYERAYSHYAKYGGRVLALATREVSFTEMATMLDLSTLPVAFEEQHFLNADRCRFEAKNAADFQGFAVFECPLKVDSKSAVRSLMDSGHRVCMITGDAVLTACHVAQSLSMTCDATYGQKFPFLVLDRTSAGRAAWQSIDTVSAEIEFDPATIPALAKSHTLCVHGGGLEDMLNGAPESLNLVTVFARVSPSQKEDIILTMRSHGDVVLMCGDGTNDVGALKQADVGIALLNNEDEQMPKKGRTTRRKRMDDMSAEAMGPAVVQFGDASFAASFTAKSSSLLKILALNCLINAFALSVLYLDGVKLGDTQATTVGIMIALCFLFVSRSKPEHELARQRPATTVFTRGTMSSILSQFAVHLWALHSVTQMAKAEYPRSNDQIDPDADFQPNLVNSAVFLISCTMQVSTFAVNYDGRPHMDSLVSNRPLLALLSTIFFGAVALSLQLDEGMNAYLELVPFSRSFSDRLVGWMAADAVASFAVDALSRRVLFRQ